MNESGFWEIVEEAPLSNQTKSSAADIVRHGARTIARAGETALGLPGDLAHLALSGVNLAHKGITGEWSPEIETAKSYLPTAQNIRKNVTKSLEEKILPEGYLTPQGEYEKLADDFVSDLVSILTPTGAAGLLGKGSKALKGVAKGAALTSGLGNTAGFLTKKLGGSEGMADAVKAGTMLGTSLLGAPRMKKTAIDLYEKVAQEVPSSLKVSTKPLQNAVREAEKLMVGHESTKGGQALRDYFKDTMNQFLDYPEIDLASVIQADKGLNKVASQNPAIWKDVLRAKNAVSDGIMKTIKQSGRPDLSDAYETAKTLYAESLKSSKIQDWINNTAKTAFKHPISIPTAVVLGITNPDLLPKVALAATGVGTANVIGSIIKRIPGILNSKQVQRYYMQAISAAGRNSRPAFIKASHMLDKEIDKEPGTPEEVWELVD